MLTLCIPIVGGIVAARAGFLDQKMNTALTRLVMNITLPCMVVASVGANETLPETPVLLTLLAASIVGYAIAAIIAFMVTALMRTPATERSAWHFSITFGNVGFIGSVKNQYLSQLLHSFFDNKEFERRFKFHSAAKSVHHGFVGGLLEHTLGVTKNCDYFAKMYPVLNRDLLLTAAIFHDIGKLKELSTFPENDYTDAGQLLGHIMIGAEWVGDAIKSIDGFPVVLANELKHCILAHHGELEFGSPKKPALVEALALSFADNIDAKMETFRELLVNVPENDTKWQGYNRFMETNFRRTSV